MAYAHLYCTPPEKGDMTDLTVSFVTTREPRELKAYLRRVYGYTLTEQWAGITLITGDALSMQIIERRKLPVREAVWLGSLGGDLSVEAIKAVLEEARKVPRDAPLGAYMYMVLMANARKTREVLKMSDMAAIDEIFEGLGIIEYYEARGEAQGEARGKEEKAVQIARNLKKIGLPLEQIIEATGLTERQINGL
jgi:predicted transposase/invertase (TIGR01784 family)